MFHQASSTSVYKRCVAGRFSQVIFNPKGIVDGFLIDTEGTPAQFIFDPDSAESAATLLALREGLSITVEGSETAPSHELKSEYMVYCFTRFVEVGGVPIEA